MAAECPHCGVFLTKSEAASGRCGACGNTGRTQGGERARVVPKRSGDDRWLRFLSRKAALYLPPLGAITLYATGVESYLPTLLIMLAFLVPTVMLIQYGYGEPTD